MPNINIICIGKLKEKYWRDAQAEYKKRLGSFCRLQIIEKKEAALPNNPSPALVKKAQDTESLSLLSANRGRLVALSPDGRKMDSEAFADMLKAYAAQDISFAVGGSYGLNDALKRKADAVVSFSDMTMPHQLFRIVLLEQIYRAFMIMNRRTYHK